MNDDLITPRSPLPATPNGSSSDSLETDIRAIRESGLFDEAYYRANNPDLPPEVDAVTHFLKRGAAEGRQPNRLFDPIFYLHQNPDVARAKQNPLLHYLSIGEKEGRKPNAKAVGRSVAVTHAEIQCLKQPSFCDEVALFVTHSPRGRLKPHVRHYLDSLKRQGIAVILIVNADGPFISTQQIDKINGVDGMFVRRNEGYDFAAWAHVLHLHPELFDAETLYLLNDSVIGPTNDGSFGAMLTRLRNSPTGLVGLTENFARGWHIQSYFLALKRPALSSPALRKFIANVVSYNDLEDVINNFEICLAPTLKAADVECEVLFRTTEFHDDPTVFLWNDLLQSDFPFVKVKTIGGMFGRVDISQWRELLAAQGYDVALAERTLTESEGTLGGAAHTAGPQIQRAAFARLNTGNSTEPSRREQITPISAAIRRRPIVLVLGMHRSGTSLCSHILSALGVDMADDIGVDLGNDKGHWERWEIAEFHDRILRLFNRDLGGRFHDFALPVAWWADPHVDQIRRQIVGFLQKRMGDGYFGFKDPRTVRLLPVWHQIFNELRLVPRIVLCLRNPVQIARSLNARDGLDPEIAEYRWLVHMIDFFRYSNKLDFCIVEYEEWFNNRAANIEKLQKFLDLPWQQTEADLGLVVSGIIDPAARHDDSNLLEPNQPLVRTLYKLARNARRDEVRDQIAAIVSQFVGFQQLQRPFIRAFEDGARAAAAEGRLADALAEIERQRVQISELTTERDEASTLKATLAERDTTITELSDRTDKLLAALQAAQVEATERKAALVQAERAGQEHAAATRTLEAELGALRETLARAGHEVQRRVAAADRLQGEISGLRTSHAQARREVTERAAAVAALRPEIAALQSELAAAPQIGKAAVDAFLLDAASGVKSEGPRGWRRILLHNFGARTSFWSGSLARSWHSDLGRITMANAVHLPRRRLRRRKSDFIAVADRARDARQWGLAAEFYRRALDRDRRDAPAWVQYGNALKESGELRDPDKLAQAEAAYRKGLSLDPGSADTYLQLGHVLKLQDKTEEAQAAYLRALALDPSIPYPGQELSGLGWSETQLSELQKLLNSNDLPPAPGGSITPTDADPSSD